MHNEFLFAVFVLCMTYWVNGTILHIMNSYRPPYKPSQFDRELAEKVHRENIQRLAFLAKMDGLKLDI